jgi:glyoxylase-like metal-dependent hydrolase (beta-lactamase superfamily II)
VSSREALDGAHSFDPGREFSVGSLRIGTRLTWGHSKGGITYVIMGLRRPVAIVGDAVFAGSMGGGAVSYADALRTNREEIFSLPDETIICPGHGPMTSVGEEKAHNPFFATRA